MTILRKPIKRELSERIARRQMAVGPVRLREKHLRTAWDISWKGIYWKTAEVQARKRGADPCCGWRR